MMFTELKTAAEVREHARIVQRRINQRRASAPPPEPPPKRRRAPPVVAVKDDVPEPINDRPLHALAPVIPGQPTRTVLAIAADYFGFQLVDVIGRRTQAFVLPRKIGFFVARALGASLPKIGRAAQRDHSTVHHGCKTIEQAIRDDATIAVAVDAIGTKAAEAFGARWHPVRGEQ
jgi:hypothetical protein